ncbi:MAG TPA: threonine--tRNA ligase [Elusimicrobiota bacterium]|nr:threonine--tRNA ligase [Elusimicrobiota bacterium]
MIEKKITAANLETVPLPADLPREEWLHRLRHSTSHVMAQAVQELFPDTKLTIGPAIEDGFYYDFDSPHRFVPEDLRAIEDKMREIVQRNEPFLRSVHTKQEAAADFKRIGETFKLEILEAIPEETISYYHHGSFTDLCEGPHVDNTSKIRHFKLTKVAGSYWRGDEKREQLQRIYGTVWPTAQELEDYLKRMEEAKKRDHRELGPRLGLFTIQHDEAGSGFIYWMPRGAVVRKTIEDYLHRYLTARNYQFVYTPHVARIDLWKTSGHLDYYSENMYPPMNLENQPFQLKPMNCPGHILIYKSTLHSYRELPIRLSELGTVYRFERSGVLHGLMRVRGFTQDDAHVFCQPEQVESEVVDILHIITDILKTFGFSDYDIKLSTRPDKFSGTLVGWAHAENALQNALKKVGLDYTVDPGEGVFYGPKIDLKIKDCLGRAWQCSTVQVDFNNPARFSITYRDEKGGESQVFMIHRALLGSLERFFGILIEHYAGAFPVWLAPVQAIVLPISEKFNAYATETMGRLRRAGFRVEMDGGAEKVGAKIREATMQKIPYLLVVGAREAENKTVSVRTREGKDEGAITLENFSDLLKKQIDPIWDSVIPKA